MKANKAKIILVVVLDIVFFAAILLSFALLTGDQATRFFQRTIHAWLGPTLICIGMLLLGMLSVLTVGILWEV